MNYSKIIMTIVISMISYPSFCDTTYRIPNDPIGNMRREERTYQNTMRREEYKNQYRQYEQDKRNDRANQNIERAQEQLYRQKSYR